MALQLSILSYQHARSSTVENLLGDGRMSQYPGEWRMYPLADQGRRYVEETLKSGGGLASAVVAVRQVRDVFTLLPADDPVNDAASAFETALNRSGAQNAWLSWIEETARTIDGCSLIAENYEVDAGSRLLETMCPHVVTPEGILLRASCNRVAVRELFRDMSRYPSIAVIGSYATIGGNGLTVTREQVLLWAHATRYVLVGAYDEESFVAAELQ